MKLASMKLGQKTLVKADGLDPIYVTNQELEKEIAKRWPKMKLVKGHGIAQLRYETRLGDIIINIQYGKSKEDRLFTVFVGNTHTKVNTIPDVIKYLKTAEHYEAN